VAEDDPWRAARRGAGNGRAREHVVVGGAEQCDVGPASRRTRRAPRRGIASIEQIAFQSRWPYVTGGRQRGCERSMVPQSPGFARSAGGGPRRAWAARRPDSATNWPRVDVTPVPVRPTGRPRRRARTAAAPTAPCGLGVVEDALLHVVEPTREM
jgi:hypothetical protein